MWQNKKTYYTFRQANLALFVLIYGYVLIDLFEILYALFSGNTPQIGVSLGVRLLVDIPVLVFAFKFASPKEALLFRKTKAGNLVLTIFLAFFSYIAMTVFINFLADQLVAAGGQIPQNEMADELFGAPILLQFAMFCIVAPFTEEILFRGMLQNTYERKYGLSAVFISAILFGLAHMSLFSVINGAIIGALAGYIYYRTRSLWCPILFHAAYNFFAATMLPDIFVVHLPWTLELFDPSGIGFQNINYIMYTTAMAVVGALMVYALVRMLQLSNPLKKINPMKETGEAGQKTIFIVAFALLLIRFFVGTALYFV